MERQAERSRPGPDRRHRHAAAIAGRGADGARLVDEPIRRGELPTFPPHGAPAALAARASGLRPRRRRPPCRARRPRIRPAGAGDAEVLIGSSATCRSRRCISRTISRRSARCSQAGAAAGRLLRHRLPSRPPPRADHYAIPRASTRGRPPLRLSRPVLRVHRRAAAQGRARVAGGRVIVAHLGSGASMCALAGRPQRREHHGLHRARRPADGDAAGPARSRRRALPDRREGHDRRARCRRCSTANAGSRACPANQQRHARAAGSGDPRQPSPSTTSSIAPG